MTFTWPLPKWSQFFFFSFTIPCIFLFWARFDFKMDEICQQLMNIFLLKYNTLEQFYTSKEKIQIHSKWVCFLKCYNQPKRKMKTIKFGWVSVETFLIEKICTILLFSKCVVTLLLLLFCLFWKWRLNRHTHCVEKKVLSYHKLNHQWRWQLIKTTSNEFLRDFCSFGCWLSAGRSVGFDWWQQELFKYVHKK